MESSIELQNWILNEDIFFGFNFKRIDQMVEIHQKIQENLIHPVTLEVMKIVIYMIETLILIRTLNEANSILEDFTSQT